MKVGMKFDMRRALQKLEKIEKMMDKEADADLVEYGREFVDYVMKHTPPNNGRGKMGYALRALKNRIAVEFTGSVNAEGRTWQETDYRWVTVNGKPTLVPIRPEQGRPTPFLAVTGRVRPEVLRAMNVGRHHVQFVERDLGGFMRASGAYQLCRRRGGNVMGLKWSGTRHVATAGAIREEVKRRQMQVGRLVAGWMPMARLSKARMQGVPGRFSGEGRAVKRGRGHKKMVTATNSVPYGPLQRMMRQGTPAIRERIRRRGMKLAAKKRKKMRG